MSLVPSSLSQLGASLRSLWVRRLQVTQVGKQWQVVLAPPPAVAVDTGSQAVAKHLAMMSPLRRHRMRRQLSQLLRTHPRARSIFRHLAVVEHALRMQNTGVFAKLPPAVLKEALDQLQTLVSDWTALGLHDLRATLLRGLAQPQVAAAPSRQADALPIDIRPGVQVEEASVSRFIEAERNWLPAQAHP